MKKIISSILCLSIMLSMGTVAFAETNDFVLTYSNEASYEINIPASGNINKATGEGTITIEVTEANLEADSVISITASSANYNDGWYLVNSKDSTDKLNYNLGTAEGANNVASGDEVLSTNTATSTTLYVTGIDTSKVGTFTDTITFTSEIVNLISFTIRGYNSSSVDTFYAKEGMTWEEWVNSKYNVDNYYIVVYGSEYRVFDSMGRHINNVRASTIISGGDTYTTSDDGGTDPA